MFCLAGFRLLAVLDGRELGRHFDALIINRTKVFRGVFLKFEELPEFERLVEMLAGSTEAT
jgi:hypothetical protein